MKSVQNSSKCCKELPFPKLMISTKTDQVVLFTSKGVGTRVGLGNSALYTPLGRYTKDWSTQYFKDYEGSVTLCND